MDCCTDFNSEDHKKHHLHHHLKKVQHAKIFFLKSFIISLILFILSCILVLCCYDCFAKMAETIYRLSYKDFTRIFVILMGFWKILIIQFTLIPFIVMAMIEGHVKKKFENHKSE